MDNKTKIKTGIVFFHFPKTPKRRKEWLQSISRFWQRGGKDKFNVNNSLICEFHFDLGDINVSMVQGKKTLKRNVAPTFEDLKKPVVGSKRKPLAARKSLFEEIGEPSQEQMNKKTQEVSDAFCVNYHNYKEEIDRLLKQKTEQQISINKLEEIINKMQTNVNNL